MIHIEKPQSAPNSLIRRGEDARREICDLYDNGQREFQFNANIYAADDVKNALIVAQHGKCCFCERKVFEDGDVEHFRPKSGVRQAQQRRLLRPGYYWLAYDWANLMLACPQCNSRAKGNLFPLRDEAKRVRGHRDSRRLTREEPLFINPTIEDPTESIEFRDEVPVAVGGNERGTATIRELRLNRPALNQLRFDRLRELRLYHDGLKLAADSLDIPELQAAALIWKQLLEESVQASAEFAAMARSAKSRQYRSVGEA